MRNKKGTAKSLNPEFSELINHLPIVEVLGDRRLIIENHRGIRGYSKESICVCTAKNNILIKGSSLEIAVMSKHKLAIIGCIQSIHFLSGGMT